MNGDFLSKAALIAAAALNLTSCASEAESFDSERRPISTGSENVAETTATAPSEERFKLDISIKEGQPFPQKYVIADFKTVLQRPELPTGCEVTALCEDLNYLGFDIDKVTLADEFMPMDNSGLFTMKTAYIGDPKSEEGFGCSAPVIVQTADDYFESIKSPCYAADLTGRSLKELFYQVTQDRPVIVWSTIDLIITQPNYRWTTADGDEMWFNDFQHCVVIYGFDYDENTVHVADPLVGNVKYDMERFQQAYEAMERQAVIICGDSKTQGKFVPIEDKPQSPVLSRNKAERQQAAEEGKK